MRIHVKISGSALTVVFSAEKSGKKAERRLVLKKRCVSQHASRPCARQIHMLEQKRGGGGERLKRG